MKPKAYSFFPNSSTGYGEKDYIAKEEGCGMDIVHPKPLPVLELGKKL